MRRHIAALGFFYLLSGLAAAAIGVLIFVVGRSIAGEILRELLELVGWGHLIKWLGASMAAAFAGGGLLSLAVGFGLLARKGWARLLALVGAVSQVATLSWPALLGVYTLWVLLSRDGAREFARGRPRR
ncbi:MAG: hypothetical protein D6729_10320 [Deltaproteobacteria bacterium]|nr:MAG: hypothetical protein D6729_10320 [Deltaproteobacteria bacterium]